MSAKCLKVFATSCSTNSPLAYIQEGLLSEGYLCLRFRGLIFGRAYFWGACYWNFTAGTFKGLMAGKADCLKELNVSEDATPYGSELQTVIALPPTESHWKFLSECGPLKGQTFRRKVWS